MSLSRKRMQWLAFAALLLCCAPLPRGHAQEAGLWGWVRDAQTNHSLVADISIVHTAPRQAQFFHARSNTTGAYEMRGLPPGEKIVIARAEGYGFAWQRVVLESGQILGAVEFALEKGAKLEGFVADEQGLPVAGALVGLAYKDLPPVTFGWQSGEAETDAAGRFRIANVTPNRDFYAEVTHARFAPHLSGASFRAQPGELLVVGLLPLRAGVQLSGQVLDAAGNAVPQAEVRLVATHLAVALPIGVEAEGFGRKLHRVVETDANGFFTFEGITDGSYRLLVRHPQFVIHQQSVELDRTVSPTVSLEVRLQART